VSFDRTELTEFPTPAIEPESPETVPDTEPDEPVMAVRISQFDGLHEAAGAATQLQDAMSRVMGVGS